MTNRRVVRERIDPRLTASLFANYRSAIDAVLELVDNAVDSRVPERRWYQLETALREVCVTIPEATVPEFERKVNELMLVSLSLTGRRKQRRGSAGAVRQAKGVWAS